MTDINDRITLNAFGKLEYHDSADVLRELRRVETQLPKGTPNRIRHLRANGLKRWREVREAALFCYGMSCRIGQSIYLSAEESADHDFVATWTVAGVQHFAPVQLKELVPEGLNQTANVDDLVTNLVQYQSDQLTVAVHLNRALRFDPQALLVPKLHIAALWFFWSAVPNQSEWCLFGDVLGEPQVSSFSYPT